MRLHILTLAGDTVDSWPFFNTLTQRFPGAQIFAQGINRSYQHLFNYIFRFILPAVWTALRLSFSSCHRADPADVVIVPDHVVLTIYWLVSRLTTCRRPKLILAEFIYTPRKNPVLRALRRTYFRFILRRCFLIQCFSQVEVGPIRILAGPNITIRAVHYGIGESRLMKDYWATFPSGFVEDKARKPKIVAAGRSQRDYATLAQAIESLDADVACEIVCDNLGVAPNALQSDRIQILRDCFGNDYLRRLLGCDLVVVPLSQANISSGQMAFMHALGAGKPVIVTRTDIVETYCKGVEGVTLVPAGDALALEAAIKEQLKKLPLTQADAQTYRSQYEKYFSDQVFADNFADMLSAAL